MANYLSAGVYSREQDFSFRVPEASTSLASFAGYFDKGPTGTTALVTNVNDLVSIFGKPNDTNFNDWYQASTFLDYGNKLYISRAIDEVGVSSDVSITNVSTPELANTTSTIFVTHAGDFIIGQKIRISDSSEVYTITATSSVTIDIDRNIESDISSGDAIYIVSAASNAVAEVSLNTFLSATTSYGVNAGTSGDNSIVIDSKFDNIKIGSTISFTEPTATNAGTSDTSIENVKSTGNTFSSDATLVIGDKIGVEPSESTLTETVGVIANVGDATFDAVDGSVFTVADKIEINGDYYTVAGISTNTITTDRVLVNALGVTDQINVVTTSGDASLAIYEITGVSVTGEYTVDTPFTFPVIAGLDVEKFTYDVVDQALTKHTVSSVSTDGLTIGFTPVLVSNILDSSRINLNFYSALNEELYIPSLAVYGNESAFENATKVPSSEDVKVKFFCKWAGTSGNELNVGIYQADDFADGKVYLTAGEVEVSSVFDNVPTGDSVYVVVNDGTNILETFIASFDPTAKDYKGSSLFIDTVIFKQSDYIYSKTFGDVSDKSLVAHNIKLVSGSDGSHTTAAIQTALDEFSDAETFPMNILIAPEGHGAYASALCKSRLDTLAVVGAESGDCLNAKPSDIVANLIAYTNSGEMNLNNTYAAFYGNYAKVYCKYSDTDRWINVAGICAGLRAQASSKNQPWTPNAGLINGVIKNVKEFAFSPNVGMRDLLYKNRVNPLVEFAGKGKVVWGQKTVAAAASAYDRINVRMASNYVKTSVNESLQPFVFSNNTSAVRNRIVSMIDPFMRNVKQNGGVYAYKLVCNESNNTPFVIDSNKLIVTLAVQWVRTAEFIELNVVATPSGVDFSDFIG